MATLPVGKLKSSYSTAKDLRKKVSYFVFIGLIFVLVSGIG
jgi:hypothetical protein